MVAARDSRSQPKLHKDHPFDLSVAETPMFETGDSDIETRSIIFTWGASCCPNGFTAALAGNHYARATNKFPKHPEGLEDMGEKQIGGHKGMLISASERVVLKPMQVRFRRPTDVLQTSS